MVLAREVKAESTAGFTRTLAQGSRWVEKGTVAEGTVYEPEGDVLTVEGRHVREAFIVVRDDQWVGFWLPYEEDFSPVASPVAIRFEEQ